jgi:tRNA nucleotidyltransferase (CCA-adding enzyme)
VEDYTELGIADIHNKKIRTPLPPLVTFKDDPLRVLRCFRFKARFDFSVDE